MDEPTTTGAAPDAGAVESAQPAPAEPQAPAATEPTEPNTTANEAQADAQDGDDNLTWLQKAKGIDPADPQAIEKVVEMYRQAEKTMHQSTAKASELQKALGSDDHSQPASATPLDIPQELLDHPVLGQIVERLGQLEAGQSEVATVQAVGTFFATNPEAKQFEEQMAQIVTDNPTVGQLVKSGYLSYDQLLAMAKGSDPSREAQLRTEGGREALQQVADKQQGKAVPGRATSSAMSAGQVTKENFDAWYAGLSAAERRSPENQRIVSQMLA